MRPYCNEVTVKVANSALMQNARRKEVYVEQPFKITNDTSFEMLRDMSCEFWGLNKDEYSLYDQQFGHLMALNAEITHPVYRVPSYFEALKMRYPLLYLRKDNIEEQEQDIPQVQRDSARIQNVQAKPAMSQNIIIENAK